MSKRATIVVDLQNEYLPTGQLPLVGLDAALSNAARVVAAARALRSAEPASAPGPYAGLVEAWNRQ